MLFRSARWPLTLHEGRSRFGFSRALSILLKSLFGTTTGFSPSIGCDDPAGSDAISPAGGTEVCLGLSFVESSTKNFTLLHDNVTVDLTP